MPAVFDMKKALAGMTDEQRWKAESDLRALEQAEEVKADTARLKRARLVAEALAAAAAVRATIVSSAGQQQQK